MSKDTQSRPDNQDGQYRTSITTPGLSDNGPVRMRWFRMYDEILDDPKLEALSLVHRWRWVQCLCIASRSTPRGTLPCATEVAYLLRLRKPKDVTGILKALKNAGLIDEIDGNRFAIHGWNKRQFASDNVTARTQKHKSIIRGNVPGNVLDSESDSDTEKESSSSTPPAIDDDDIRFASEEEIPEEGKLVITDAEGLDLVCKIADKLAACKGIDADMRAVSDLGLRIKHDWQTLAMAIVRIDRKIREKEVNPEKILNVVNYLIKVVQEIRSDEFPGGERETLAAKVDEILAPEPEPISHEDETAKILVIEVSKITNRGLAKDSVDIVRVNVSKWIESRPVSAAAKQAMYDAMNQRLAEA